MRFLTQENSVWFSPEKHKLLKDIEQEKAGCEIKQFKGTERNEILITDYTSIKKMKLGFMQPIHNAVFQEISTVENELPLFDMVNVKGIVYSIGALETASKGNKLIEFQKASLKDNTGSMPITFYNELTKQQKEGQCYEIIEVRITKYMTQRLLKTTEFTEISEIEDNSFQLTDDDLNLHQNSLEGKVVSVDLKTLRTQILCKKCKSEVILEDGMFDCENCDKISSEIECLKISKVAFTMVGIYERFNLTASKEIVEACYSMPISRKKELGKKILKKIK